jgi:UrcA family protein
MAALVSVVPAEPAAEQDSVTISYESGMTVQELYSRIRGKAVLVCKAKGREGQRSARRLRACKKKFVASAVERFGIDDLTELHEALSADQSRLDRP